MKLEWEKIEESEGGNDVTWRAPIEAGWLVLHRARMFQTISESMVFVPDHAHIWSTWDDQGPEQS